MPQKQSLHYDYQAIFVFCCYYNQHDNLMLPGLMRFTNLLQEVLRDGKSRQACSQNCHDPDIWFQLPVQPIDATPALTQSLHKPCCRSGLLAAIAPKDGAPTVQVQDRTIGEFENHDTGVNLIL
jgi:hypothetical protein